jgi:molecular chaperone Hsp33
MIKPLNKKSDDRVLPFQLDVSDIRGRMARLDSVLDEILSQHDYPLIIEGLVTEMVLLTALIGQTMKLRWKLSLQVRGNGPVRLIATDYYGPIVDGESAKIRAYASYDADKVDLSAKGFSQIGKGHFAILIDQGPDTKPYQGITPISGGSLSACAETYFAQSEQLPTRFSLAFGHSQESDGSSGRRAGGIMLQHMPTSGEHVAMEEGTSSDGLLRASDILDGDDNENWSRVNLLMDPADELEMVGPLLDPEPLIRLLFHEENPRIFEIQKIKFGCTCSEDRVRQSLSIYSAKDIGHMTTKDNKVTADCQFCGSHYTFEPSTLGFEANSTD